MDTLLRPWPPAALNIALSVIAFEVYDVQVASPLGLLVVMLGTGLALLCTFIVSSPNAIRMPERRDFSLARPLALLIVVSSMIEYRLYGIPIAGDVLYTEFGAPLLHHVSVTSWLLVFISAVERRRLLAWLMRLFAVANPILMLNRDVLLLTLFSMVAIAIMRGRIRLKWFAIAIGSGLALFGFLGETRSPNALQLIDLPFRHDMSEQPAFVLWPLIYMTGSMFNMLVNFDRLQLEPYFELINVFPESFAWASLAGSMLMIPLFYAVIGALLALIHRHTLANRWLVPLYIYFLYQAYMTGFSSKFFTTNSVFVVGLFIVVYLWRALLSRPRIAGALTAREASRVARLR